MSSVTRVRMTPVVQQGTQMVDLSEVLGEGGCKAMCKTLEKLPELGVKQLPGMAWVRDQVKQDTYNLQLSGNSLPAALRQDRNAAINMHLKLGNATAQLSWEFNGKVQETQAAAYQKAVEELVEPTVAKNFNQLPALAIQQEIHQRLETQLEQRLCGEIEHRVLNTQSQLQFQSLAMVRGIGG